MSHVSTVLIVKRPYIHVQYIGDTVFGGANNDFD